MTGGELHADNLVDGMVTARVLGDSEQRAVTIEQPGGVQATGLVERTLCDPQKTDS